MDSQASRCALCTLARDLKRLTCTEQCTVFIPETARHRGLWSADFDNYFQHDASQAYTAIIDTCDQVDRDALRKLCESVRDIDADDIITLYRSTPAWKVFGGIERSTLRCKRCGKSSIREADFNPLSLKIAHNDASLLSLSELLYNYELEEDLKCEDGDVCNDEDEVGFAKGCGGRNCRCKRLQIVKWPNALVIHFGRFEYDFKERCFSKRQEHISFGTTLQHSDSPIYQLRGVLVHTGSYDGGHYTAYVRNQDHRWFFCDDQLEPVPAPVPVFDTEDVLAQQAYMLFYESM